MCVYDIYIYIYIRVYIYIYIYINKQISWQSIHTCTRDTLLWSARPFVALVGATFGPCAARPAHRGVEADF